MASTGLMKRNDDGNWIAWIYLGPGNQPQKSMGTTDKAEAERRAYQWWADMMNAATPARHERASLRQLRASFERSERFSGLADATQRRYAHGLDQLEEYFGEARDVGAISRSEADGYRRSLRDRYADSTVNSILHCARVAFRFGESRGWVESSPFEKVRDLHVETVPAGKRPIYTPVELDALQAAAEEMRGDRPYWPYLFAIARYTGVRKMEPIAMNVDHVDLDSGWIDIPGTKNANANRGMPILVPLRPYLENWIDGRNSGPLFPGGVGTESGRLSGPTVHRALKRCAKVAGLDEEGATYNRLRRSFISWAIGVLGGHALPIIQTWVGHGDPSVTFGHYTGQDRERERELARQLVEGISS